MNEVNQALRGGIRAVVGVGILGVGATLAVLLSSVQLPSIERAPIALTVDSLQGAERTLVCAGSFAELGADPNRPGVAVPVGGADVTIAGVEPTISELIRAEAGGTPPMVLRAASDAQLSAAQVQRVSTAGVVGTTASSCVEPANEQWLIGGSTQTGVSTTLSLGNPSQVAATVKLTLFDETGQIDSSQITGVLVPPGSERVVSINGYAPDRERIAVQVTSTGAAVTASLGVGQTVNIQPFAADVVTRQLTASRRLVIPAVGNPTDKARDAGDAELLQDPVRVRVLAPQKDGTATVFALGDEGAEMLGSVELIAGVVTDLTVPVWPENASAVVVEADIPVVGGAFGSATEDHSHDYAWFAPASLLLPETDTAVAVVQGGMLVITNPGDSPASVTVTDEEASASAKPKRVEVPARTSVVVAASANSSVRSSVAVALGVRVVDGGNIGGYPVIPLAERNGTLTVYTR